MSIIIDDIRDKLMSEVKRKNQSPEGRSCYIDGVLDFYNELKKVLVAKPKGGSDERNSPAEQESRG